MSYLRGVGALAKEPKTRWLALIAFALALSVFAWWPMLASYPGTQTGDGPFYHKMIEAARVSVLRYHELPLWNPYECGGVPLWDNPQGVAGAPLVWLSPLVGTTRAIELWYVLHSVIGFVCMWVFSRRDVGLSRAASLVAAASWTFAGVHNQHLTGGHFVWVPYLYYPLALHLWRRAERDARAAVGTGIIVALSIYEGGAYPLPHLAVLLGLETLTRVWPPRRVLAIARAGAIVGVVGFTLGASRFLPVLDQLRHHTRQIGAESDFMHWSTLADVFLARAHERFVPGQEYVWPEFGDYLGPIVVLLALIGLLVQGRARLWMVGVAAAAFLLMCGHFASWAPWHIMKEHIYPYKQMRVPSRFVMLFTLFVSAWAGVAIDRAPLLLGKWGGARLWRSALVALALIGVGDLISVGMTWCAQCFDGAPQVRVVASTRLFLGGPDMAAFLDGPAQNRGRLECWEEWGFEAGAPLWTGDVPQARATDDGAVVEVANRTQNTFTLDVDVKRPSVVLLNSAYDRGWRTSVGQVVRSGKQLAVELPAGRSRVKLHYWPAGLSLGFALSGASIAGMVAFFILDSRRRRRLAVPVVNSPMSQADQTPPETLQARDE